MDGPHWIDLFWTSVIYGWTMICGFQRFLEACILHEVFAEYQQRLRMFLCKTTFAENWFLESCEIWCGDDEDGFCHLHGNLECRLLSSHVHARQQTPNLFQPGFFFNNFVDVKFCGTGFRFCCMWATGMACLWMMWSLFFNNSCMADFSLEPGWLCFRNLMLQHGARQQIREKDNSTVQRLTDSRTAYFGCFRVLRKRS